MNEKSYNKVVKAFEKYYEQYKDLSKNIILKYNHSYNVANLMEELSDRLYLSEEDKYLAKTIGLLHDIGRFEQLKEFDSFDDKIMDHAVFGVKYLFEENHIRDFIKDDKYDNIIKESIANHNLIEIKDGLSDRELLFAKMIRDMDKTDIFFQIAVKIKNSFIDKPSDIVLEKFNNRECISHELVVTDSDRVINLFSFLFNYYFDESLEILKETDNFGLYISTIEVSEEQEKLFNKIKNDCYKIIGMEIL